MMPQAVLVAVSMASPFLSSFKGLARASTYRFRKHGAFPEIMRVWRGEERGVHAQEEDERRRVVQRRGIQAERSRLDGRSQSRFLAESAHTLGVSLPHSYLRQRRAPRRPERSTLNVLLIGAIRH